LRKLCLLFLSLSSLFLAAIPAYSQRGTFGIDAGQTSDKYDTQSANNAGFVSVNGKFDIIQAKPKDGKPGITVGGDIRFPSDTNNHPKEFAIFGGPYFEIHNLTIGVNVQVRKIIQPIANQDNQTFPRSTMEVLELPPVITYKFGPDHHVFIQAQGAPEFTPHFHVPHGTPLVLPNPNLDHGYYIRGTLGYNFGKWYARASYETSYFKFNPNNNNPSKIYNWRADIVTAGIGINF